MVSFVCNQCQETIKKPKLDQHAQRCRGATFSCIDCSTDFYGTEYRNHTSCISEAEKYQKSLYKPKVSSQQQNVKSEAASPAPKKQDLAALSDDDIRRLAIKYTQKIVKKEKQISLQKLLDKVASKVAKKNSTKQQSNDIKSQLLKMIRVDCGKDNDSLFRFV
ncbi:hypothetical protein MP228_000229 [Amoeboaphelidium protococcarum]|nr:hypothetical protein MP228_000229 [Amoeboaphelidium protococcarum]